VTDASGDPIDRIPSGSLITYTVTYENTSDSLLERPTLALTLPEYFDIDCIDCGAPFDEQTNTVILPDLIPGASGYVDITGRYFGIPNTPEELFARLTYTQEGRTVTETRHTKIISTLRGSLLEVSASLPTQMLANGEAPFTIVLTNTSRAALDTIYIPLEPATDVRLIPSAALNITNSKIEIEDLGPSSTVEIAGTIQTTVAAGRATTFEITPEILIDGTPLPQAPLTHTINILHPSAALTTSFDRSSVQPGDTIGGTITLTNTGDTPLRDVTVQVPLASNIIDTTRLPHTVRNGAIILTPDNEVLRLQETITLPITLPIKSVPSGSADLQLRFEPTLTSNVTDAIDYTLKGAVSPAVSIGTQLLLSGHAIYYTPEGDQLGRGPLPPRIGEETRYFAILQIRNTTSRVRNASFSGTLPTYVRFTGKTSVSTGNDITYNETTRTMGWNEFDLQPFETVGLYIELGVTPSAADVGNYPTLIQNMQVTAEDTFISTNVTSYSTNISTELHQDSIGKAKGDTVVN
jgi:uncharacterized repeat protein (TIGR01451 family)